MDHSKEAQHVEIRLLACQGTHHCEILRELKHVHGAQALSLTTVHRWMTETFSGCRNFATVKQTGCPPKLTRQVLVDIRAETRRCPNVMIRELSVQFGLALSTIHWALKVKLKLKKHPCIWQPHELSAANKTHQLQVARQLLAQMRRQPCWASRVIMANETWVFAYELTRK